jgi:hypothetical protein
MDAFRRSACFTVARDTTFSAVAAATLIVAFSYDLALAFAVGAGVQLLFVLLLLLRLTRLSDERIARTEAWRVLAPSERPAGEEGRRLARWDLELVLLHFAKAAASVAVLLFSSSLLYSFGRRSHALYVMASASLD